MEVFLYLEAASSTFSRHCKYSGHFRVYPGSKRNLGLSISSLWVYLTGISACLLPVEWRSVFTHPATIRFMGGLVRTFPPGVKPTPQWDLNCILSIFTRPPFEPLATCYMSHLSMKVVFLITITLARRVSEFGSLHGRSLYPFASIQSSSPKLFMNSMSTKVSTYLSFFWNPMLLQKRKDFIPLTSDLPCCSAKDQT